MKLKIQISWGSLVTLVNANKEKKKLDYESPPCTNVPSDRLEIKGTVEKIEGDKATVIFPEEFGGVMEVPVSYVQFTAS